MSLEGSEANEDIYEYYLFDERRKSMIRNSNNSRSNNVFIKWKVAMRTQWT